MTCPECLEPTDTLVQLDGLTMCPECRDAHTWESEHNDHLWDESLESEFEP